MHKHHPSLTQHAFIRHTAGFATLIILTLAIIHSFSRAQDISYTCDASTGLTEFNIPTSFAGAQFIAAGPDGNIWFPEYNTNKIGKVTPEGIFTEYDIPTAASGPKGLTGGPDGNVWFVEQRTNKIARITTDGTFTEYAVPTAESGPMGITSGPDGNLWFTEGTASKIGKITTDGMITEYTVPTENSYPAFIITGPDGNLWFTELNQNKIAKVTTAGEFTEYTVPTTDSYPFGITVGPDGNLWFTEHNRNKIAKVTTDGVFTEYALPTTSGFPHVFSIASGPDGNMWVTVQDINMIVKFTVATGEFTEYPILNGGLQDITAGPGNTLWFPQMSESQIGKITCTPVAESSSSAEVSSSSSSSEDLSSASSSDVASSSGSSEESPSSSSASNVDSTGDSPDSGVSGGGTETGDINTTGISRGHGIGKHTSALDFILEKYGLQPQVSYGDDRTTIDQAINMHAAVCTVYRYFQQLLKAEPNAPDDYVSWITNRFANAVGKDPESLAQALLGRPYPAMDVKELLQSISDQGCAANAYMFMPSMETATPASQTPAIMHEDGSHLLEPFTTPSRLQVNDESTDTEIAFSIRTGDETFTDYGSSLTKEMHLLIVRNDLRHFYHLHPDRDRRGLWQMPFVPDAGGTYWLYANFTESDGHSYVLRFERTYAGDTGPTGMTADPSLETDVDGYHFQLEPAMTDTGMSFTYHITDVNGGKIQLQNYMGAFGHSVILSTNGYFVHSHPSLQQGGDPIFFIDTLPSGQYRIFTQFEIQNRIRTVIFDWEQ